MRDSQQGKWIGFLNEVHKTFKILFSDFSLGRIQKKENVDQIETIILFILLQTMIGMNK